MENTKVIMKKTHIPKILSKKESIRLIIIIIIPAIMIIIHS